MNVLTCCIYERDIISVLSLSALWNLIFVICSWTSIAFFVHWIFRHSADQDEVELCVQIIQTKISMSYPRVFIMCKDPHLPFYFHAYTLQ